MKRSPLFRHTAMRRTGFRSRNKYGAVAVHDMKTGATFDSKGEHLRYTTLELLQKAGEIADLQRQVKIILVAGRDGAPEIAWHVDAAYTEKGRMVYEDFKRPEHYQSRSGRLRKLWTDKDYMLLKLWRHFGPGLLRIVGAKGTMQEIMPAMPEARGVARTAQQGLGI